MTSARFSLRTPRLRAVLALAILGVLALGVKVWLFTGRDGPLLATPRLAIEALPAGQSLYFNGAALPWLLAQRAELLTEEERDERSGRARVMVQAVQNPKLFRQLDRQRRFGALLLTGDPSQYRPLLEHLLEAKDFAPVYVDATSVIFQRDAVRGWEPGDLAAVRAKLAQSPVREQAKFLALTGGKLVALRRADDGRKLLEEALALNPKSKEAWSGLALLHMNRGAGKEAMAAVEKALAIDGKFLPALATKTQLLYASKYFSDAYDLSTKLVERVPDDPGILFYHAKIAHEAHAYRAEIKALAKLIAMAEAAERPTAGYRVYLGQAYAAAGDAKPAVAAFSAALADPELPVDQREFAEDNLARIRKRAGL